LIVIFPKLAVGHFEVVEDVAKRVFAVGASGDVVVEEPEVVLVHEVVGVELAVSDDDFRVVSDETVSVIEVVAGEVNLIHGEDSVVEGTETSSEGSIGVGNGVVTEEGVEDLES